MSKFFKTTQGNSSLSVEKISPNAFDIDQLLEAAKKKLQQGVEERPAVGTIEPETSRDHGGAKEDVKRAGNGHSSRSLRILPSAERLAFGNSTEAELPAAEAYKTLRTRLLRVYMTKDCRSVVVTSAKHGEGKTLTVLNLALCYAQVANTRVLLVDGDLRSCRLTACLGASKSSGLSEALEQRAEFEDIVSRTDVPHLYAVGAGRSTVPSPELFTSPRFKEFMEWATRSFTLVIIDSPPILELADFELMSASCNAVLLVIRSRVTGRQSLEKALAQIEPTKIVGVVFNAADSWRTSGAYPAERKRNSRKVTPGRDAQGGP
jgi:protein-tyrosine kinase